MLFTFHLVANYLVPTDPELLADAFNQQMLAMGRRLVAAGHTVHMYGSSYFRYPRAEMPAPPDCQSFCTYYHPIFNSSFYEEACRLLGGYIGFNDGLLLDPNAGSETLQNRKSDDTYAWRRELQRVLLLTTRRGDFFCPLWDRSCYELLSEMESRGCLVVRLCEFGALRHNDWPFRYATFASRFMRTLAWQQRLAKSDSPSWAVIPPLVDFPYYGGELVEPGIARSGLFPREKFEEIMPDEVPAEFVCSESGAANSEAAAAVSKITDFEPGAGGEADVSEIEAAAAALAGKLGIDVAGNVRSGRRDGPFLFLGRVQQLKGALHFIAAARRNPGKTFWLAGKTPCFTPERNVYRPEVSGPLSRRGFLAVTNCEGGGTEMIDLSSVPNLVYFGFVDRETRFRMLSQAAALVQLSCYPEPFGLNAVESLACGTPVIVSNCGAYLETVEDGVTGFHVATSLRGSDEMGEQVDRCLSRVGSLSRDACRRAAQPFHPDKVFPLYLDYFAWAHADWRARYAQP